MEVLLVGGSGFIGRKLQQALLLKHIKFKVLTRKPKTKEDVFWDPSSNTIDLNSLAQITHVINLAGEGIANSRWSQKRKKELINSRVNTTRFLYDQFQIAGINLQGYIGVSGTNAFGFDDLKVYAEDDAFGTDFLSQLVEAWEKAHKLFDKVENFSIARLGMVLSPDGGAYAKIASPMKFGLGAIPGKGKQMVPWVHASDVVAYLMQCLLHPDARICHVVTANDTMEAVVQAIARREKKKLFLPNIPSWVVRILFGEMGNLLTESLRIDNQIYCAMYPQKLIANLNDFAHEKEN